MFPYLVLIRTLVTTFYQENAGFFFITLGLAFGVLHYTEHYYIIRAAFQSYLLLSLMLMLWTLYLFKTIGFTLQSFMKSENQFLYQLYLYPVRTQFIGLLAVHMLQFLPILFYAFVLITIGTIHGFWITPAICCTFLLVAVAFAVYLYKCALFAPGKNNRWVKLTAGIDQLKKPGFSFFLFDVIYRYKLTFLYTKVVSLTLLIIVANLYASDQYDERLAAFTLIIAALANNKLLYRFHDFNQNILAWQRNTVVCS